MNFIKKNLSNILFVLFIIFLFTPYGLPVRSLLIKGVSIVKTKILPIEMDEEDKVKIDNFGNLRMYREIGLISPDFRTK